MRRIMMDATRHGGVRQLIDRPRAEAYVLKIPEPDSGNAGPTGFLGVSDIVRSRQSLEIEVEHSGNYVDYYRDNGARFIFKPNHLRDENDDSVVGTLNPLGGEQFSVPVFSQTLMDTNNQFQLASPKMIQLERWGRLTTSRGVVGMLGVSRWTGAGATAQIMIWTMNEYTDHDGLPQLSYQWDLEASKEFASTNTSTALPAFDLIELDDGSIISVVVTNNKIEVHKTYDCGENWDLIATIDITNTTWKIAVDKIGSRIVIAISKDPGGVGDAIFTYHSDDGGFSWSSANVVLTVTAAQTVIDIDLRMGQNGVLFIAYVMDVVGTDRLCWKTALDGIFNEPGHMATTPFVAKGPFTFLQEHYGRWLTYGATNDVVGYGHIRGWHTDGTADGQWPWHGLASVYKINYEAGDVDGCDFEELSGQEFFDGGFVDVVGMVHDTHGIDEYWNLVIYRLAMWSGIQFDSSISRWDNVWTPHAYPSTNDPHPNLKSWTEAQAGAGAIGLGSWNDFIHMEITSGAGADVKTYRYPAAGDDTGWVNGVTARFELKVVEGYGKVNFRLTSAVNNKDVNFTLQFQTDRIILWDENAGMGADIIIPTDWDPTGWNEYLVVAKGNDVQVFRTPSGLYREIAHYEQILSYETLQEDPYGGAGDTRVIWGVSNALGNANGTTETHWRSMMVRKDEAFSVHWVFDLSWMYGKRCHHNPVGLLQGIACKWTGIFALDSDGWQLDVGAHFDADNIFVDSPRIHYSDPVDVGARSSNIVIDWRRHEGDETTCMNYVFDSIAMFGMNTPIIKLEGSDFAGVAWDTLYCNNYYGTYYGGPMVYEPRFVVNGTPDQNVLRFTVGTSNMDTWLIPNQFASTQWRKWYIIMLGGTCNHRIYRIDGNSSDELYLECNIESDGVTDGNYFNIFSDRFLHIFDRIFTYPRVRLTITMNSLTPSPSEKAVRLGTVLLGKTYDLPDDKWESNVTIVSGVNITKSRARMEKWREIAPERRSIDLSYSGQTDCGMGINVARELYRHARWGIHPVVWIDDDTALLEWSGPCSSKSPQSHVDPILARVGGPLTQQRKFYSYEQQDGNRHIRGVHDVGGITLEEIL